MTNKKITFMASDDPEAKEALNKLRKLYKDFGIGIEEHFQRKNGFYWLNQFLVFFELDELSNVAINKYQEILLEYPMLPDTNYFNFYPNILF